MDRATLDLIEQLVTYSEVRHLLLIGAYRDNEVGLAHPLRRTLDAIRNAGAPIQEIVLTPLRPDDVGRLVADALHCDPEHARPVAELVQEKTGGNPFFAIQFFTALAEEGLLAFDPVAAAWQWEINRVRAKSYTDNVVAHGGEAEAYIRRRPGSPGKAHLPGQRRRVRRRTIVHVVHPIGASEAISLQLPGQTMPYTDAPIFAQTSGYLKKWCFDVGAEVKTGAVLAEIDTPEVDAQLAQAQAQLKVAQAARDLSKITYQRFQDLFQRNVIAAQDFDTAADNYGQNQATVLADRLTRSCGRHRRYHCQPDMKQISFWEC